MIDYVSPSVNNSKELWKEISDIMIGGKGIKDGGEKYMPKESSETPDSYNSRLAKGTFLDSYNPTINGISGLIFKNPIQYGDDIPSQVKPFIENADMQGSHFDLLLEDLFKTALNKGISFALVDLPKGEKPKNKAEEQKLGIKPYSVVIQPENIEAWKTETINGQIVLTMVKIRETTEVPDPENIYANLTVNRYRVLYIGRWEVWEKQDGKDVMVYSGETDLDFIPLLALNLNKKGFFESFPTFYDLYMLNIAHYQVFSDIRHNNHIACVPMLKFIGFSADEVKKIPISANTAIATSNTEADVGYLDYEGKGAEASERTLNRLESKMSEIGLSVISQDKTLTATEVNISGAKSQSKLNGYVRALEDTAELILLFVAKFYGLNDGGSISIESDILSQPLNAQEVTALNNMVMSGNMSVETMWSIIASGAFRLPAEFDAEVEKEKISSSGLLSDNTEQ